MSDTQPPSTSASATGLVIGLVILGLAAAVLAYLYLTSNSKNATLTTEIATLTSAKASLSSQVTTLNTQNTTLTSNLQQATALANTNASTIATLTSQKQAVQSSFDLCETNLAREWFHLSNFISGIYIFQTEWNGNAQTVFLSLAFAPTQAGRSAPGVCVSIMIPPTQSTFTTGIPIRNLTLLFSGSTQGTSKLWFNQVMALESQWMNNAGSLAFSISNSSGTTRVFSDGTTISFAGKIEASGPNGSGGTSSTTLSFTDQPLQRIA